MVQALVRVGGVRFNKPAPFSRNSDQSFMTNGNDLGNFNGGNGRAGIAWRIENDKINDAS